MKLDLKNKGKMIAFFVPLSFFIAYIVVDVIKVLIRYFQSR